LSGSGACAGHVISLFSFEKEIFLTALFFLSAVNAAKLLPAVVKQRR